MPFSAYWARIVSGRPQAASWHASSDTWDPRATWHAVSATQSTPGGAFLWTELWSDFSSGDKLELSTNISPTFPLTIFSEISPQSSSVFVFLLVSLSLGLVSRTRFPKGVLAATTFSPEFSFFDAAFPQGVEVTAPRAAGVVTGVNAGALFEFLSPAAFTPVPLVFEAKLKTEVAVSTCGLLADTLTLGGEVNIGTRGTADTSGPISPLFIDGVLPEGVEVTLGVLMVRGGGMSPTGGGLAASDLADTKSVRLAPAQIACSLSSGPTVLTIFSAAGTSAVSISDS